MTPQDRFAALADELAGTPGVTPPGSGGGFGSATLRFQNRIFAMLSEDRLVVKLPKARVDELIAAGNGVAFDGNKGKPMKEWLRLDPASQLAWLPLAKEAMEFVS